jgi:hypothetical protein
VASTPEGRVKNLVKCLLSEYNDAMYFNMPVPTGYGVPMLDFVGCYHGQFFAVETKAPGKKPTRRQNLTIAQMSEAGGAVFVIDGEDSLVELGDWLERTKRNSGLGKTPSFGDT